MVPFKSVGAVSYSPSIVTGSILHQFRDKARYWSKIVIFSYPLHSFAFDAPVRGIPVGIFLSRFVLYKLE